MAIDMFNFWYFFWIVISIGIGVGLYFLLQNRSEVTQRIVLLSVLIFSLVLHFLKLLLPPYNSDSSLLYNGAWFVNLASANILLFPILFITKNKYLHDYIFYLGVILGAIALFYPADILQYTSSDWLSIIIYYIQTSIMWIVPLLMVILGVHQLEYRRILMVPVCTLAILLFVMVNQILMSELGYIPMRGDNILDINYQNTSLVWGPNNNIAWLMTWCVPKVFRSVPVGEFAGVEKYWPWFWLIVPVFVLLTPVCFAICMIFEHRAFRIDCKLLVEKIRDKFAGEYESDEEYERKYGNIPEKYRPKRKRRPKSEDIYDFTENDNKDS